MLVIDFYTLETVYSLNPVSYTHLDVYKRQVVEIVMALGVYTFVLAEEFPVFFGN